MDTNGHLCPGDNLLDAGHGNADRLPGRVVPGRPALPYSRRSTPGRVTAQITQTSSAMTSSAHHG